MLQAAIVRFGHDQSGATAIEYGLVTALIAVTILGALAAVGTNLATLYAGSTTSAATIFSNATSRL